MSAMRAALDAFSLLDWEQFGDVEEMSAHIRRASRDALVAGDREPDVHRQALQEIRDGYGPNHGSSYCKKVAEEALK